MQLICAWCGGPCGEEPAGGRHAAAVSHGMCADCMDAFLSRMGTPLAEFLETLDAPVVLLDAGVRVQGANRAARSAVPRATEPDGRLAGEVFECANAVLPGGCGRTIHCSGCTLRRTVEDTFHTGEPHLRVPATLRVTDEEDGPVHMYISTVLVGDQVVLRIEPAIPERS